MIGSGPLGASPLGAPVEEVAIIAIEGAISYETAGQLATVNQSAGRRYPQVVTIKQGDSLALMFGLGDVAPLWDWTCDIAVKSAPTDEETLFEAVIENYNLDGTQFQALLPDSLTIEWAVGSYYLLADLRNPETGEAKAFVLTLIVEAAGLTQDAPRMLFLVPPEKGQAIDRVSVYQPARQASFIFPKAADALSDIGLDWSQWLHEGDYITASEWVEVETDSLALTDPTHTVVTTGIWIGGGEFGEQIRVTNRIETAAGRTDERTVLVRIVGR